jgi:putative endonuclease
VIPGYTSRYGIKRLIWFGATPHVHAAITREKQIKGWIRAKKAALIESQNPARIDLAAGWYDVAITTAAK